MTSQDIKRTFFDFFNSKQHDYIPSAPIVLKDDPTLMFTNAGMNQFKSVFLGTEKFDKLRVYNTQKCLRVSGKHNDLEEVGIDHYHHTMFEMMGNWSFGNYFKKEAIAWAWELLTEVYKIDKSLLYVTVFEGSEEDGLSKDDEAYAFWKEIVDEEHIILGNKKDNFWEMGEQGPCGPSSEIHIDLRSDEEKKKTPAQQVVNHDHPDVIEIWNLVFIEFNRKANGALENLPNKHVDTGMGFERLCRVLQHKSSNYDTDIFQPIIKTVEDISGLSYGENLQQDIAFRVVADHIRAVAFCIVDGQLPSSNGAGYVIRRILRRAVRYAYNFLNVKEPFMFKLVDILIHQFENDYPEIKKYEKLCKKVIKEEEQSFLNTLSQGLKRLDDIIENTEGKVISGEKVFELFDTYGFPKGLTALILREKGLEYNHDEFNVALENQKKRSKSASESSTGDWHNINYSTEGAFIGYDTLQAKTRVLKYRTVESKKDGKLYQIVLDKTPFYPEGGGQVGDRGAISFDGEIIKVIDTKKEHGDIVHILKELPKKLDGAVIAQVSKPKRFYSECNHTATHLLHFALRNILGTHVEQKGSLVNEKHLRFDFSHFEKISAEDLSKVEHLVNTMISDRLELQENRTASFEQAKKEGAMALFGEKYGDKVRTIRFGNSIELCGGTHVRNTSEIWYFKILNESSIASGVRRIEAITNITAKNFLENILKEYQSIEQLLGLNQRPIDQVEQLMKNFEQLKSENEKLLKEKSKATKSQLKEAVENVNGIHFISAEVDFDAKSMKDIAFELGGEIDNLVLVLGSRQNEKALLCCYISKTLVESKGLNAGKIVKSLGRHIKGGGGGQAFFATAGGKEPDGIPNALNEVKTLIQ
jgi:alanyl-tRNA synthetase